MVAGMAVRERQGFGAYYCPAFVARVFVITYSCEEPGNVVASSASCNFVLICLCTYLLASPSMALNAEGHALLGFVRNATADESVLSDWNGSQPNPCRWTGIQCSENLQVLVINLARRKLHGPFTLDTRKLRWLQALNLSSNNLEGEIPTFLRDSTSLRNLNLHSNKFSGAIPADLGYLQYLEELDLSNNHLRGGIPGSLNQLTRLSKLNVSINHLQGLVPQRGVLASFPQSSFEGNVDLCGYPIPQACNTVRSLLTVDVYSNPAAAAAPSLTVGVSRNGDSGMHFVGNKKLSLAVIVIICFGAILLSKIFLGGLWYWRRYRLNNVCEIKLSGGKMVMFQLSGKSTPSTKSVMDKIEKLAPQDIIGSGGYGTVYKLTLDNQSEFAVKKLARGGLERERGFERELETLADLKHKNLVALRGYYSAPHINILVYDLMRNGSLDTWLHEYKEAGLQPLDWETRVKICIGTARGLAYLHHDCVPRIIHRDIKASNILLDEEWEPRIADFGLAKLMNHDQTHVTTMVAGTLGYVAPEYVDTGLATDRGDIYSFGVMILELVTGRRPCDDFFQESGMSLPQWVRSRTEKNKLDEVVDEVLVNSCQDEEMAVFVDTALFCTSHVPSHRPNMIQVVKMLENHQNPRASVSTEYSNGSSSYTCGDLWRTSIEVVDRIP